MSDLRFDINHLNKYAIIKEPCTAIVRCNSTPDFNNPYTDDGYDRWIINLKVVSEDSLDTLKLLNRTGAAIYYSQMGHLLLSGAIWKSQIWEETQLPVKGENVIATFDYVDDRLMCTAITVIPKTNLDVFEASAEIISDIEFFKNLK